MEKIGMSFLFLFFGNIYTIICESGKYLEQIRRNRRRVNIYFYGLYFISIIILGFSFLIFQIFINIISFILIIIDNCFYNKIRFYFNEFYSILRKIKRLNVMDDDINSYILKIIIMVYTSPASLFF